MATTGVMRPGHIQLRVLDLDESVHFYSKVLGLIETGRDTQGRVYLKAWDERDHHSVVLREADSAGMDYIGFKVRDRATLERL
ncbi:VOC family protein, partial [Zoogloea sp.]|uniref:VOC family protein n=1 Tax=Zoogloea sp. TaxID=49181 RepID=UPI001416B465